MNLQTLKNFAYRTKISEGTVTDSWAELARPGPAGVYRVFWYLGLEGKDGLREYRDGFLFPLYCGPVLNQLVKGDKVRTKLVKILGVPVFLKVERS